MSQPNHPTENIFTKVSEGHLLQVTQRVEFKVELNMPTSSQENTEEVVIGDIV